MQSGGMAACHHRRFSIRGAAHAALRAMNATFSAVMCLRITSIQTKNATEQTRPNNLCFGIHGLFAGQFEVSWQHISAAGASGGRLEVWRAIRAVTPLTNVPCFAGKARFMVVTCRF
jgi:hypothetical protein